MMNQLEKGIYSVSSVPNTLKVAPARKSTLASADAASGGGLHTSHRKLILT
jgi:hypothetical protein